MSSDIDPTDRALIRYSDRNAVSVCIGAGACGFLFAVVVYLLGATQGAFLLMLLSLCSVSCGLFVWARASLS